MPGKCSQCEGELALDTPPIELWGIRFEVRPLCSKCSDARTAEDAERKASELANKRRAQWERVCPPAYAQTDPKHQSLDQETLREVIAWSPHAGGLGMALHGPTGIGKTRMMWLLLKRLHFAGTQFKAIRSTEFAQNAIQQFSDNPEEKARALSELRSLKTVPVLFIDDLGKERATARLETELYELLEERTSRLLPILFTTQLAGQALASMLSRENGEAIVRRLREFCEFIAMKSASVQRAKQRFA